jgi:catechol 2,3-dioxygenase-like lactoylglutathione lyase family enzyme
MSGIRAESFNHVAIRVSDMRRSADWYVEHLGMEAVGETGNHIFLKLAGGQVLALFRAGDPSEVGGGLHHIALNLPPEEKERAYEDLRKKGFPLERRGPSLGFPDPDGYWIHF